MPWVSDHCILCGAVPPPPLTGEHILPDWYSRLHPDSVYELEAIIGDAEPVYSRETSLNLKPQVLCEDCNNRWGSTFENTRVRPIILPLAECDISEARPTITLSPLACRRLAAWATLKAMVAEYLVAEERGATFFFQKDRQHLRQRVEPPSCVGAAWVGRYYGTRRGWVTDKIGIVPISDSPRVEAVVYAQTLVIGSLVVQVLGHKIGAMPPGVEEVRGFLPMPDYWERALTSIWPIPSEPIEWPPDEVFDNDGIKQLTRRWHQNEATGQPENDPASDEPPTPS